MQNNVQQMAIKGLETLGRFSAIFTRERTVVTSCLLSVTQISPEKEVYSRRKEFAPAKSFLFELTTKRNKEKQNNFERVNSPERALFLHKIGIIPKRKKIAPMPYANSKGYDEPTYLHILAGLLMYVHGSCLIQWCVKIRTMFLIKPRDCTV